jgi:hypothetical protein
MWEQHPKSHLQPESESEYPESSQGSEFLRLMPVRGVGGGGCGGCVGKGGVEGVSSGAALTGAVVRPGDVAVAAKLDAAAEAEIGRGTAASLAATTSSAASLAEAESDIKKSSS